MTDFLGLQNKDQGIFLDMPKKVAIFLGRQILVVVIFLGIKYEPLSEPPPPHPKKKNIICEWGPGKI